jgi:very-short-patch-repair endonuclease
MRKQQQQRSQLGLLPSEWPDVEPLPSATKKASPEDLFAAQCRQYRLPAVEPQHRFAKAIGRQWRFDFAFPDFKLAVEIEGLVVMRLAGELVVRGRHASIKGIKDDMEKYNTAALFGWTVLRFQQQDVKPERAIHMTQRVLAARGWKGFAHEQ